MASDHDGRAARPGPMHLARKPGSLHASRGGAQAQRGLSGGERDQSSVPAGRPDQAPAYHQSRPTVWDRKSRRAVPLPGPALCAHDVPRGGKTCDTNPVSSRNVGSYPKISSPFLSPRIRYRSVSASVRTRPVLGDAGDRSQLGRAARCTVSPDSISYQDDMTGRCTNGRLAAEINQGPDQQRAESRRREAESSR
jgi:hypothetical protein